MFRNTRRVVAALAAMALLPAATAAAQDPVLDHILALPDQTAMNHASSAGSTTAPLPGSEAGVLGTTTAPAPEAITRPAQPIQVQQPPQQPVTQPNQPKKKLRNGTTCKGKRVRTCVTYRKGKLVKRCVTRHHHRRCAKP